jgi:hypothetical protein
MRKQYIQLLLAKAEVFNMFSQKAALPNELSQLSPVEMEIYRLCEIQISLRDVEKVLKSLKVNK